MRSPGANSVHLYIEQESSPPRSLSTEERSKLEKNQTETKWLWESELEPKKLHLREGSTKLELGALWVTTTSQQQKLESETTSELAQTQQDREKNKSKDASSYRERTREVSKQNQLARHQGWDWAGNWKGHVWGSGTGLRKSWVTGGNQGKAHAVPRL